MIRHDHPTVDMKRILPAHVLRSRPKHINVPNQPVVGIALKKIDGEKVTTTRNSAAAIVGHGGYVIIALYAI